MARHGLFLGLLCAVALSRALAENYYVILPLYNGGQLAYLTSPNNTKSGLAFMKPSVPTSEDDVRYLKQYFFIDTVDFPYSFTMFSWSNQDLFLDSTGGVATFKPSSGEITQLWEYDRWGRLFTKDHKYMAQYSLIKGYGGPSSKFSLVPAPAESDSIKGTNQFIFAPNYAPYTTVKINSLKAEGGKMMCLDSGRLGDLVIGAANTPTATVCNGDSKEQEIELLPPFMDGNATVDGFPLLFRIKFAATGLCLALSPPFGTVKNNGRAGNSVLQVDCESTYSLTTWKWNTRGQLQSFQQWFGTQGQALWVCLHTQYGLVFGDSCSLQSTTNRWNIL